LLVDHVVGAQLQGPVAGFRTRGGADHGHLRQLARQLQQDRADTAGGADHQQGFTFALVAGRHVQAVEQHFPGRQAGQRQRRGRAEIERCRHVADDALVHQLQFAVAAGARDRAGVPDAVARLEQGHVGTDRLDDAGRVPAQHLPFAGFRLGALAHLGVDRVDRHRAHLDQQVVALRDRVRQGDVDQRLGVVDREAGLVSDGFHGKLLMQMGYRWLSF